MKRLYILGAGASADFSPERMRNGSLIARASFVPFPVTRDFISAAVKEGLLRKGDLLSKFITEKYGVTFEDIAKRGFVDIEQLYCDVYEEYDNVDADKDSNGTGHALARLFAIEDIIRELLLRYSRAYAVCRNYSAFARHAVRTGSAVINLNWDTCLEEALSNTGEWFYDDGYGFKFDRIYLDKEQQIIDRRGKTSAVLLIKPHGSINWFRYADCYSAGVNGFTNETLRHEDSSSRFLMLWDNNKITPRRFDGGKNFNPWLKGHCILDIMYPRQKFLFESGHRSNAIINRENMSKVLSETDEIIIIGFALKNTDAGEFGNIALKKSAKIILVNLDQSKEIVARYRCVFKTAAINFSRELTFSEYCKSLTNPNNDQEISGKLCCFRGPTT